MKNKGIEIFNDILDLCEKLEVDIHQDSTPKLALTECIGVMRTSYKFSYDEVFLILKRLATRLGGNSKIDTMPMMEMAQFCLERLPVKEGESKPVDWRNCRHDFPPLPNTNILRVCSKCGTTEVTVLKYQVSELNSQLENSWGEVELWTKAAKLNEERWHAERKAKEIAKDWMRRTASLLKLDVPDEVLLAETSNAIVKLLDERSIDKAMIDELRTWLNKSSMTLRAVRVASALDVQGLSGKTSQQLGEDCVQKVESWRRCLNSQGQDSDIVKGFVAMLDALGIKRLGPDQSVAKIAVQWIGELKEKADRLDRLLALMSRAEEEEKVRKGMA